MNTKNIFSKAAVAATSVALLGIMPMAAMAAVPAITSISPASGTVGGSAFTMTINGTNFEPSSTAYFNGLARSTGYVSPTQLNVFIPASDLTSVGTFNITVNNPTTGGGTSNAVTFTVGNVVPVITSLSPASMPAGSSAISLTINGNNFMPGSVVSFSGNARATSYVSANQLTAVIPASDLTGSGTFNVTVTNPTPGGGTSTAAVFTVTGTSNNPVPSITSISPTSVTAGSGSFTLTVNGSNFVSGSTVRFNGIARTTTFVSANQVRATILASDVATAVNHAVQVVNPTPGGGTSNALLFTVAGTSGTPGTPGTPGLPNTGFGPQAQNGGWMAIAGIAGALAAVVVARQIMIASAKR